jgi:hypothetical protein
MKKRTPLLKRAIKNYRRSNIAKNTQPEKQAELLKKQRYASHETSTSFCSQTSIPTTPLTIDSPNDLTYSSTLDENQYQANPNTQEISLKVYQPSSDTKIAIASLEWLKYFDPMSFLSACPQDSANDKSLAMLQNDAMQNNEIPLASKEVFVQPHANQVLMLSQPETISLSSIVKDPTDSANTISQYFHSPDEQNWLVSPTQDPASNLADVFLSKEFQECEYDHFRASTLQGQPHRFFQPPIAEPQTDSAQNTDAMTEDDELFMLNAQMPTVNSLLHL